MKLNILCIGDVVGRPGRRVLAEKLKSVVQEESIDCVIANAENAAGGSGLTCNIYQKLMKYGVNLVTLGDHTYRKKEIISVLETENNIVRPANLSETAAGRGAASYKTPKGPVVSVVSLIGRTFMKPANSPFTAIDSILPSLKKNSDIILVDMHAEATSEKIAMGWYLDGKVGCVFGTHTHVATADERILPHGTAYITDIGMTGPHESVLGRDIENVLKNFKTLMPYPFAVATGDVRINSIVLTIDSATGRAERIKRLRIDVETTDARNYDSDDGKHQNFNSHF